jgi:hypothetical protein
MACTRKPAREGVNERVLFPRAGTGRAADATATGVILALNLNFVCPAPDAGAVCCVIPHFKSGNAWCERRRRSRGCSSEK